MRGRFPHKPVDRQEKLWYTDGMPHVPGGQRFALPEEGFLPPVRSES